MKTSYLFVVISVLNLHGAMALKLQPWEQKNLEAIHKLVSCVAPKESPFSEANLEKAQPLAFEAMLQPGFSIVDLRVRLGICQLMAWYSMDVLKEARSGQQSIDQVLHELVAPPKGKLEAPFALALLGMNLRRLGLMDEQAFAKLGNRKSNQLYNLLEGWVTYRAIDRLLDGKGAENYLTRNATKVLKEPNPPYEIANYDELSTRLFTTKLRDKTLVLAFYRGIPSLRGVMSHNTVAHVMVLRFNKISERWEIQTQREVQALEGNGFKLLRVAQPPFPDKFVMTQDSNATAAMANVERIILPEDDQDYVVVHMGNIFQGSKGPDETFLHSIGLDRANFEDMFLRRAPKEAIPGTLSVFHFNGVKDFRMGFYEALKTYQKPNEGGFSFHMGLGSLDYKQRVRNHPILFKVHTYNPMLGDYSPSSGVTITHTHEGKRLILRLVAHRDWVGGENYRIEASTFYRKFLLCQKDCGCYGSFRPPAPEDWAPFVDMFKTYVNTDIAPIVRDFLNTIGFNNTKENRDSWIARGPQLIANSVPDRKNYRFHLAPQHKKQIERTKKQVFALAAVHKTKLHSKVVVPSHIYPSEPSADSLFNLVGITRKDYIKKIVSLMQDPTGLDPHLIHLIDTAIDDLGQQTLEEWAILFDNPYLWPTYTHMRIIAELYNLRIMLYQLDREIDVPGENPGDAMFIPHDREDLGVRVVGRGTEDMHVAVVNKHFVNDVICGKTWQFEQIHLLPESQDPGGISLHRRDGDDAEFMMEVNATYSYFEGSTEYGSDDDMQMRLSEELWATSKGNM